MGSLGVEPRPLAFQASVTQNLVHQEPSFDLKFEILL